MLLEPVNLLVKFLEKKQTNFAGVGEMVENLEQQQDVQEEWDGLML